MTQPGEPPRIAIACGGTGGHLFPGLAVAEVLQRWSCDISLLVSQKEVDQEAVKSASDMRIVQLPAVALQQGRWPSFLRGFWKSYHLCRSSFLEFRPRAVLAMGGFTSAPPVLAGKSLGAVTFIHESNAIPGRANRWLSPWVDRAFVGFPQAARRLYHQSVRWLGTPVRSQFKPSDPSACRMSLGLNPKQPVLLVMGGSQGASGINALIKAAIPQLAVEAPDLQFLHLTGPENQSALLSTYAAHKRRAVVRPFLTEMELALGAATLAVNRAGASSLAELAAMQVPALLVPYPHATDDHQYFNARALADTGASQVLVQATTTPELLSRAVLDLLRDSKARATMRRALAQWHFPQAATDIAAEILECAGLPQPEPVSEDEEGLPFPKTPLTRTRLWKDRKLALLPGGIPLA